MSGSISQQLEDLLHPQPKFLDPEDDGDEETKARVVEKFAEDDDEEEDGEGKLAPSSLRKQAVSLLSDSDSRYAGKAVSRKQLMQDMGASEEEEQDDDDDDDDDDDEDDDDDNEEEAEANEEALQVSEMDDDLNEDGEDLNESEVTFPKGDFRKLTEGMDDLGMSEGEEDEGQGGSRDKATRGRPRRQGCGTKCGRDQDAAPDVELEERKRHVFDDLDDLDRVRELRRNRIQYEKVEDESEGDDESSDEDDMEPDDSTVQTFSQDKVSEEVEKGLAVKNQLALWDQLLEGRIKFQKAVVSANQLPQPSSFSEFKRNAEYAGALKNSHKALKALQRSLLELHDELLVQNVETRGLSLGEQSDEEILSDEDNCDAMENVKPQKRKLEMAEYPDIMSKRFAAFTPYQNATLQKWQDKTRLTMGKTSKAFGAFERNILTQIEQVLMDKDRLIKRTQTRRSEYQVMGKKEGALFSEIATLEEEPEKLVKTIMHLKDLDEDIFDDDDFYHQLLRELIERKTSAADPNDQVAMGKQWLAIQKLRSKIKKKVDTKASKGRKVRFHIHSKLVNFMAPIHHSDMTDEAKSELYRGLFGQNLIRE